MSQEKNIESEDLTWQMHMRTLMKRKRSMEIAQIIGEALKEYYAEKGKPVPNWRQNKNPEWWIEYLKELGLDPDNS